MLRRYHCARALSLVISLVLAAGQCFAAQAQSSLRIKVLDPKGAAIIAAEVLLKSASGLEQSARTGEDGEATFARVAPGLYHLSIIAEGFESHLASDIEIKQGVNHNEVRLEVARVSEEVAVKEDERERALDPRGNAFSTVLTQEQIDQLPDDPEELEQAIRRMGGPGARLRVNGFSGGKLPPKSQIREIRFRMNPYAAENHDQGFMSIDVFTKPGIDTWHGSFNIALRHDLFSARNLFAPVRPDEQNRRFGFSLDVPLWRNHTSLFLSGDRTDSYDSKTIVAATPEGNFTDLVRRPADSLNLQARLEHSLTKTHTLRAEYQRSSSLRENLGVGDFDLSDRAFSTDQTEHILRASDSGALGSRLVNEFRFQARWQQVDSASLSDAPAVIVLNAFNTGGAQLDASRRTREFEFADNVDFVFGKHSMKAGVMFEAGSYESRELRNSTGTFTFASLADFRANRPAIFTRRGGDPLVEFDQYQFAWYLQDDFRLSKAVTLSLGLRHETQTHLKDSNNFAPRFGLAWSPFKSGKTTFRAGAGIFYDWFAAETFEQSLRVDGSRQIDTVVLNPGFPDPFGGGAETVLPPSRIVRSDDLRMPYTAQASVGLQQEFAGGFRVFANYFYQRGVHLLRGRNINAPVEGGERPDPTSGNITEIQSTANSTMHGLNVNVSFMRPRQGFFVTTGYFLSKTTDEADGPLSLPANNFDLRAERGPSSQDVRHRVFGMMNTRLFMGFRLGTVFSFSTAAPYNITTGFDDNGDSQLNDRPAGVGRNSARGAVQWDVSARLSWGFGFGKQPEQTARGARPVVRRVSNSADALDVSRMPGANDKRYRMEFYLQSFNLFNHANRINFSGVQTSPFFGQATAAQPGRRIETGMRFTF